MVTRIIPSTGEALPVVGLGTWQTFDVQRSGFDPLRSVLRTLYAAGGRLLDSSPMYGRAEEVVGSLTEKMPERDDFFYATKVWTRGHAEGQNQMEESFKKLRRPRIDLLQIHNLVDWQTHLPLLRKWKEEGLVRYLGITHYLDSSHEDLLQVLKQEPFDFVQFNYSLLSRRAEKTLLPFCADHGVATLINRPFGEGSLFRRVSKSTLPDWALEAGLRNWGSFFLAYLVAHPAVTCVIPATGNPDHAAANLEAVTAPLPDENLRKKLVQFADKI